MEAVTAPSYCQRTACTEWVTATDAGRTGMALKDAVVSIISPKGKVGHEPLEASLHL